MKYVKITLLVFYSLTTLLLQAQGEVDMFKKRGITVDAIMEKTSLIIDDSYYRHTNKDKSTLTVEKFQNIYDLSVLNYFGLTEQYDTELKIKTYKRTPEYAQKLSELRKEKGDLNNSIISLKLPLEKYSDPKTISNYDLKKKAFTINLGGSKDYNIDYEPRAPKTVYNISTEVLKVRRYSKGKFLGIESYRERFDLKMDEAKALKIENNIDDIEIFFLVKIGSEKNVKFLESWDTKSKEFEKLVFGGKVLKEEIITRKVMYPEFIRLVIINKRSQEIYYDNIFTNSGTRSLLYKDRELVAQQARKKELEAIQRQNEQNKLKAIENEYNRLIDFADLALNNKSLQKAKEYYQEALRVKKEEGYPTSQIELINKTLSFLDERRIKIYDYQEIDQSKYTQVKAELDKYIATIHDSNRSENYSIDFTVELKIDTLGKVIHNTDFQNEESKIIPDIKKNIAKVEMPPVYKNDYSLNAVINEKYQLTKTSHKMKIKVSKSSFKLIEGNAFVFKKYRSYITDQLSGSDNPNGTYSINLSTSSFNGTLAQSIEYLDFKGVGGPSNALLSVVIPGLGNHFVNGGKGSMLGKNTTPWVTTIGTLALVGTGVGFKITSDKNYDLYLQSTTQTEIDKYYDLANSQNKRGYALMGIGVALWIGDIIWTAKKGANNKREERRIKEKLNLAFSPVIDTNQLGMSLTIKIN